MSKLKKLKKRLTAFASQLTPDECREQLVLSYLQMERCQQVLRGEDVEPVTQMDNGESSDLELFYLCKKVREELTYFNDVLSGKQKRTDKHVISIDIDASEAVKNLRRLAESFKKLGKDMEPRKLTLGHEVFFMSKGRIHKSILMDFVGMVCDGTGDVVCRVKGYDNAIPARCLYGKPEELIMSVGKGVSDHVSLSRDKKQSFFIDHTNRVFRGAEWYLEDQKIDHFDTLDELRKFLLENIIDDGKEE